MFINSSGGDSAKTRAPKQPKPHPHINCEMDIKYLD